MVLIVKYIYGQKYHHTHHPDLHIKCEPSCIISFFLSIEIVLLNFTSILRRALGYSIPILIRKSSSREYRYQHFPILNSLVHIDLYLIFQRILLLLQHSLILNRINYYPKIRCINSFYLHLNIVFNSSAFRNQKSLIKFQSTPNRTLFLYIQVQLINQILHHISYRSLINTYSFLILSISTQPSFFPLTYTTTSIPILVIPIITLMHSIR